jgi:transcriptional regulator with XRE-family HTH domain
MTMAMETGSRIMELRRVLGLTQEQLGQQVNVSGQAVSKWENGDSLPDIALIVRLAGILNCTTDYLLGADKVNDVERYIPMLEQEMRGLSPSRKIDLAFRLFHLIDKFSYTQVAPEIDRQESESRRPFVHAGPDGITVWWEGKLCCNVTLEALMETEQVWLDAELPFDLFCDEWDAQIIAMLGQERYFGSDTAVPQTSMQASDELMEAGLLEKGRGGCRMNIRAEVLLRMIGVLLRTVGYPGTTSQATSTRAEG